MVDLVFVLLMMSPSSVITTADNDEQGNDCLGINSGHFQINTSHFTDPASGYVNIAGYGSAVSDSVGWGGHAWKAIDGNTNGDYTKYVTIIDYFVHLQTI